MKVCHADVGSVSSGAGPIVLAVNPYEWIDELYASDTATQYLAMKVIIHHI